MEVRWWQRPLAPLYAVVRSLRYTPRTLASLYISLSSLSLSLYILRFISIFVRMYTNIYTPVALLKLCKSMCIHINICMFYVYIRIYRGVSAEALEAYDKGVHGSMYR